MREVKVACLGEAMVELALDRDKPGTASVGFAGDTLNTAIYLKRCAPDIAVSFVTRLGQDRFSGDLENFIGAEQISTDLIGRSTSRSVGLYAISTDAAGERSFSYWRDTSAARTLFSSGSPSLDDLAAFDVLYFSAITLAILSPEARSDLSNWLPSYRKSGGRVAFDSNYRPALWPDVETAQAAVSAVWAQTDIALPSVDDERALFGDRDEMSVISRLRDHGVKSGALKRGALGPVSLALETGDMRFDPATTVVDSTAAGDSFNGGYLAALLKGNPEPACLQAGHELACRVIGVKGAIIPA